MDGGQGKIQIVDDEPDVLESTALLVESLGYTAVRVSDASEVVDTAERERPDVILQDLRMPGLNLAGLVAALRLNPVTAEIPMVFFSAHADVPAMASRYGAWGHLAKPFRPEELARILQRAVARTESLQAATAKELRREVQAMFHEQWNLLAALGTYLVLVANAASGEQRQRAVDSVREVLLKLEAKTDRLQAYMLNLVDALEPDTAPRAPSRAPLRHAPRDAEAAGEAA